MRKSLALPFLTIAALSLFLLIGCSNQDTTEACLYETSTNLDKGDYDAVLASSCADALQIGAAWLGKAGFDMTNVINRLIDANDSSQTRTDLNLYMTSLTSNVTGTTLTYIDNALTAYNSVSALDSSYQDAQFQLSISYVLKSLSLIRTEIPDSVTPEGTLNTNCDRNNNQVPDDADATACMLLTSAGQTCTGFNALISSDTGTTSPLTLQSASAGTLAGQYRGLVITVNGTGPSSTCPSPNQYRRLLFLNQASQWTTAVISGQTCQDVSSNNAGAWPCALESNNAPIDFTASIDTSLTNAVAALNTAITVTSDTDVQQSIQDIRTEACGPDNVCMPDDIANYLLNNLK